MSDPIQILRPIERKRVAINLRVLPETAATLNQYVGYLCELAAKQGLNESQITMASLIDHYARAGRSGGLQALGGKKRRAATE